MNYSRCSGILLHPTSLPGWNGIGDFGVGAFRFVDFLHEAKQTRWQVLPLGPTGFGDSPYASFSSFAGNPLLISLDRLVESGNLKPEEIEACKVDDPCRIDFGAVIGWKMPLLKRAAERFLKNAVDSNRGLFESFCGRQASWLDDYALFMSVKEHFDEWAKHYGFAAPMWCNCWDRDIADRKPAAISKWKSKCSREILVRKVWQFWFFEQWLALKQYANERSIRIVGDLPIFVSLDSVDVWSSPQSFLLNDDGSPIFVAGVPPDYFSETGQRWGNPLYDWRQMEADGFEWWIRRIRGAFELFDLVRVDHFRGFEACWTIPANEPTAKNGEWVPTPGKKLFEKIRDTLGEMPLIAEDLGLITPEVEQLRDAFGFPGMRVLQFAFDTREDQSRIYLPHNFISNCVVYTGTHDNDTICGWFANASEGERQAVAKYLGHSVNDVAGDFIRLALSSIAETAIIPMQDILGFGSESRMNTPSTTEKNWVWRMPHDYADGDVAEKLAGLTSLFDRNRRP